MIQFNLEVPFCWKDLVLVEFEETDEGLFVEGKRITSEKNQKGDADPEPYYDDYRIVDQREGDFICSLTLASGQSNYFGGCVIENVEGDVLYQSTWESYADETIVEGEGQQFQINIKWVEHGLQETVS